MYTIKMDGVDSKTMKTITKAAEILKTFTRRVRAWTLSGNILHITLSTDSVITGEDIREMIEADIKGIVIEAKKLVDGRVTLKLTITL